MARQLIALAMAGALAPALAHADTSSSSSVNVTYKLTGSVDKLCSLGTIGSKTLNVGTMINPSNGTLGSVSSQNTSVTGSWCNTASTISVLATPMIAQSFTGTPPGGFTKAVNYTATVSGWTAPPASFTTNGDDSGNGSGATPDAQNQANPETTTITVGVGTFKSPNTADLLVADPNYSGNITLTLAPQS